MARDTVVDDAIGAAMDKLEARASEAEAEKEPAIEGVDENTTEAEEPKEAAAPEAGDEEAAEAPSEQAEEQITDKEANSETSDQGPTAPAVAAAIEPPGILSAETKALWSKVPADVASSISRDILRTQQQMSRLANESQRSRAWEERVNSDFSDKEELDKHRAMLRAEGVNDEIAELHRYRAWNKVLSMDPLTAVRRWIVQHEITPEELSGQALREGQEHSVTDPRFDEISQKLEALENERKAEVERRERQEFASKIESWKVGKDRYGEPRAKFAGLYGPQIDQEWQKVLAEASQLGDPISLEDSLTQALDRVQDRVYQAHGINPAKPKPQTVQERIEQAKKAAAARTVASGAPRSDQITKKPKREYKNDKERVEAAIERAEGRIGRR